MPASLTNHLPWLQIHTYVLETGKERQPKDFYIKAFKIISRLIPFDTGMLYVLGNELKPIQQIFLGMDSRWSDEYLEYYSQLENGRFYFYGKAIETDWSKVERCEFKNDYINPQRINHSIAIHFYNADGWPTAAFVLNRCGKCRFTPVERVTLEIVREHLINLHANLTTNKAQYGDHKSSIEFTQPLTTREIQIVDLLCSGMSPGQISKRKKISRRTVYNHLANIYKKTGVYSQRELVIKFMSER